MFNLLIIASESQYCRVSGLCTGIWRWECSACSPWRDITALLPQRLPQQLLWCWGTQTAQGSDLCPWVLCLSLPVSLCVWGRTSLQLLCRVCGAGLRWCAGTRGWRSPSGCICGQWEDALAVWVSGTQCAVVPQFLLKGRQLHYLWQKFVATGDLSPWAKAQLTTGFFHRTMNYCFPGP